MNSMVFSLLFSNLLIESLTVELASNCSDVVIVVSVKDQVRGERRNYHCFNDLSNIENNSEITLYAKEISVSKVVEFIGITNLSLIGINRPVLTCPGSIESGLSFKNIHNLTIKDVRIQNCGHEVELDTVSYKNLRASLAILNSAEVHISDLSVLKGPGSGLVLFDIEENVTVLESSFEENGWDRESGGNGVYLEISEDSKSLGSSITYKFTRCRFQNNHADTGKDNNISGFTRFDKGGGLCFLMRGQERVKLVVENATILGNTAASYGGGIFASYSRNASNSVIVVKDSVYRENWAPYGGAQYSGYLHNQRLRQTPLNCSFMLEHNTFTNNSALYGGGVSIFSTPTSVSPREAPNNVKFAHCTWKYNTAQFGSAVTILPNAWNIHKEGFLPSFSFSGCTIDSNFVRKSMDRESSLVTQYTEGSGAFYCTDHTLNFYDFTTFSNNNGSALYMGSCKARFRQHSETTFTNNTGYYGGAIYLLSSVIQLEENMKLLFISNTAYSKGGAIYHNSFDYHMYNYSRTCFYRVLYSNESDPLKRNITVRFEDNFAGNRKRQALGYGHSMYVYSLLPCHRFYKFHGPELSARIFDKVGNFTYNPESRVNEIATDTRYSQIIDTRTGEENLSIIPGKVEQYPFADVDDLSQQSKSVYLVTVQDSTSSSIKVNQAHRYISTNEIGLSGDTNAEATIVLSALSSRQRALFFKVKVLPCPPGFVLNSTSVNARLVCTCAYGTKREYKGIQYCQTSRWRAYQLRGFWIGYKMGEIETEDSLVTGYCPIGFCNRSNRLLPPEADREKLSHTICTDTRSGTICGHCTANHSVFYHSHSFVCKPNNNCKLGWLFYLLSEIVPVTITFIVIIFFNITFTSGRINGFIFYSQVVSMFRITGGGFIPFPAFAYNVIQFLYLNFNLDFLVLDELSFCFYENANTLDIIALNYVTLAYTFVLIIGIVVAMNKLNTKYCFKLLRKFTCAKRGTFQGSIIHGLSALLVLCYAKCARASILLISYAVIRGKGSLYQNRVVFHNGEMEWFSKEHLLYLIPAIVIGVIVVLIPPILLLIYPTHYKVLAFLKISEKKCVRIFCNPLEKLKPLLDSFQGDFKDNCRFFSGLYFLYRLLILINASLSSLEDIYFFLMGQLIIILFLHSIIQPYKNRKNNTIDTILFLNLAMINCLTMYNFAMVQRNDTRYTLAISCIQSVLILLPLIVMFLCLLRTFLHLKYLYERVKTWKKKEEWPEEEMPSRLACELNDLTIEESYSQMNG